MNKIKKIITLIIVTAGMFFLCDNILAQNSTSSAIPTQKITQKQEVLRGKTLLEINRRLTSLTNLSIRVEAMKKLSKESQNSLILQVQDQINDLNTLKVKIENDTDIQSLNEDRLAVKTEYRIYLLFIPKMHILATADRINEIAEDMDKLVSKIQIRIDQAKQNGKDVSVLQSDLDEIKSSIADANIQAKTAVDLVAPLIPDGGDRAKFSVNKQVLQNARKKLVIARQDLSSVKQSFEQIRGELNPNIKDKTSSTSAIKE